MGYGLGRKSAGDKASARTVLLASADLHFRARLRQELTAMRWQVREAAGGAEAMALLEAQGAEAMVLDSALPDLEVTEFAGVMRMRHPVMDLLRIDGVADDGGARSPRRNELLHALRQVQQGACGTGAGESTAWALAPVVVPQICAADRLAPVDGRATAAKDVTALLRSRNAANCETNQRGAAMKEEGPEMDKLEAAKLEARERVPTPPLPEMVGESQGMLELSRLIRLVAPRLSTVLIEGETGTGKELVAHAVHQLSTRSSKPFVVLNCAAIPESLLEAELFGHTRGAFTGAVELQRVGNNEVVHVDVRVLAATDEPLQQRVDEHAFRLDLYHRLAVFPVALPALRERMEDVLPLAAHLLGKLGEEMPVKRLSDGAAARLMEHNWPGNVRELAHVLERATILAEDRREIARDEIQF
jgi:DNA-binding NtrC family response regulator